MTVYSQNVRIRLVLHQHEAYSDRRGSRGAQVVTLSEDVIQASFHKDLGQVCGGATFSLVPRKQYLKLIRQNDWMEVFVDSALSESSVPFMIVSVDRCRRSRSTGPRGDVSRRIVVHCRDYGKVFLNTTLVMSPLHDFQQVEAIRLMSAGLLSQFENRIRPAKPHEAVKAVLDQFHHNRTQCTLPASLVERLSEYRGRVLGRSPTAYGGSLLVSYLALAFGDTEGTHVIDSLPNVSGNLWGTMESFVNNVLNEMWVDTENGLPTLHLEERPFGHDAFAALAHSEIDADEVKDEEISSSDDDTRNWFTVLPDAGYLPTETAFVAGVGYGSRDSVARAGVRKFEGYTQFFGNGGSLDGLMATREQGDGTGHDGLMQRWSGKVASWYAPNEQLLSGTLVSRFRPDIRVGTRLDYTDRRTGEMISYYVEGVHSDYTYLGANTSTISVTRGCDRVMGPSVQFPLLKDIDQLIGDGDMQHFSQVFGVDAGKTIDRTAQPRLTSGGTAA